MNHDLSQVRVSAAEPLASLREALRTARPDADVDLLRRAYDVAAHFHHGQFRRSGDPYVTHPVSVATILAGLGADDQTLCAAILHDTVEDTSYTLTAMSREFGPGTAAMVAGIMALDGSRRGCGKKLARAIAAVQAADTRVVEMKLADRLHNMQKIRGPNPHSSTSSEAYRVLRKCRLGAMWEPSVTLLSVSRRGFRDDTVLSHLI